MGRNIFQKAETRMEGVVDVLWEYIGLCVDWDRIKISEETEKEITGSEEFKAAEDMEIKVKDEDMDGVSKVKRYCVRNAIQVGHISYLRSEYQTKYNVELDRASWRHLSGVRITQISRSRSIWIGRGSFSLGYHRRLI
jgi:hypothetical protein